MSGLVKKKGNGMMNFSIRRPQLSPLQVYQNPYLEIEEIRNDFGNASKFKLRISSYLSFYFEWATYKSSM